MSELRYQTKTVRKIPSARWFGGIHNYGHGTGDLSNRLASLNILAFLLHTAFEFLDDRYRTLRFRYGSRVAFFQELSVLLRWFLFDSWDHVISVMFAKLRIDTS